MTCSNEWLHRTINRIENVLASSLPRWESIFLHSILQKLEDYGTATYLSNRQHEALERTLLIREGQQSRRRSTPEQTVQRATCFPAGKKLKQRNTGISAHSGEPTRPQAPDAIDLTAAINDPGTLPAIDPASILLRD